MPAKVFRPAIINSDIAKIPLGNNACQGYAVVDLDQAWIAKYTWHLNSHGYPVAYVHPKDTLMHHLLIGKPPRGLVTDHIDRDKLNNRLSNLRHTTQRENLLNFGIKKNNTSGAVGVYLNKRTGKWFAQINRLKEQTYLGQFDSVELASAARSIKLERLERADVK